ncbi:MAG: ABC transporter ATP-binding protein [Clostridiaceae bacterium]
MAKNTIKQDEDIQRHSKLEIIIRLLKYLKPYRLKAVGVIILMIYVMVVGVLNPFLLQRAIDVNVASGDIQGLLILGGILIVMNLIASLCTRIRIISMSSITNKILIDIREELYSHIQKLSFSFFDNRPVGKILARVIGDVNSLQELFNNSVTTFIPELLSLVLVTVMMFVLNTRLALASLVILPFLMVGMFLVETVSTKRWTAYRKKRSNLNAFTHEDFAGIKVVQAFANEKHTSKDFKGMVGELMNYFTYTIRINDLFWPLVDFSWGIGIILIYWVGVTLITNNTIEIGTLIAFTMYIGMFWRPIMNISSFYNTLVQNFSAAERIFDIIDISPDIVDIKDSVKMPKIKGNVEFKNVTFYYEEGNPVLNNVSFKVAPGENIALVGPTGAGKTTITALLSRFYDTQEGEILVDGKNIKTVEIESLRSQMGIMLQDTFLFSTTIKENIRYGKLDATDEEIIAAAKAVNAHDFIMAMDKGYDTEVNERGSRLSLGQRQLISFARAMLANPRILILDEATSNIDTFTEKLVQQGIKKLLRGRTSFVIAHRLSTIRDCDRIMVIDEGRIKEAGTHEELLELKGLYYDLYMAQYRFLSEGA